MICSIEQAYVVVQARDGWMVVHGERQICCVPSEKEARAVAEILQRDYECRTERVA